MDLKEVKQNFPEYKKILEMAGGKRPRKFVQAIKVVQCPAKFNPSQLNDTAYMSSYFIANGQISVGTGYCYESMMATGVVPTERMVDVPKGSRMWVVIYDGMWGGYWDVKVFVHEADMLEAGK